MMKRSLALTFILFAGLLFGPAGSNVARAQVDFCSSIYFGIFQYQIKCQMQKEDRRRRGEAAYPQKSKPKPQKKAEKAKPKKQPVKAATKTKPVSKAPAKKIAKQAAPEKKKSAKQTTKQAAVAKKPAKAAKPAIQPEDENARLNDVAVCDSALSEDRKEWETAKASRRFVSEAEKRKLSVDDCRVALNLPSEDAEPEAVVAARKSEAPAIDETTGTPKTEAKQAAVAVEDVQTDSSEASMSRALSPREGKRVALVIGNSDYSNALSLTNPKNDARDVSARLRELGFEVIEGENMDRARMEGSIREFVTALDNAAVALFFYAGHGIQVNGKNFLIPVDAQLRDVTAIDFETISADQIMSYMTAEERVSIVLLDACRDNPLAKQFAGTSRSIRVEQGLAIPAQQQEGGLIIGFATAPGKIAYDGGKDNSPFTAGLLRYMSTKGLEIGLMLRKVTRDVRDETNGRQTPWISAGFGGEFYFNP